MSPIDSDSGTAPSPPDGQLDPALLAYWFERLVGLNEVEQDRALASQPAALREALVGILRADADADAADPVAACLGRIAEDSGRPARIGTWQVVQELGAGGMGTVFLGQRELDGCVQQAAIKLIRGFPTEEGRRRMRHERRILAQLDHPAIARLLEGGETADGQPYVVMEYVPGHDLMDFLCAARLSAAERLGLFERIVQAVEHAHRHLVVHRDLKPGNIRVRPDGEPRLLDFGVAKLLDVAAHTGEPAGSTQVWTPGFASPEQREGGRITTATDLFGLGCLLRAMLCGRDANGRVCAPAGFPVIEPDAELRGVIGKCCEHDPQRRYASVAALRDDLQRYRQGHPLQAAPDTPFYRLRKFFGRHWMGSALTALLAGVAALFVVQLQIERSRALAASEAAEHEAARARASLDFLTATLEGAAPEQSLSSEVSVRDLVESAHRRMQAEPSLDPSQRAAIARLVASLYHSLGEQAQAVALYGSALDGAAAESRQGALALAADFDSYSSALAQMGRGKESLAAAKQAGALRQRHAPEDLAERVRTLSQTAFAHYALGQYEQAEADWYQALELLPALDTPPAELIVNVYQALASMLAERGEFERPLTLVERGMAFADAQLSPVSPARVGLLRARANALVAQGSFGAAEASLREAIDLQTRSVGARGQRMAALHNDLGLALAAQGRYREARDALNAAQEIGTGALQSEVETAITLSNLAAVMESAGAYDEALALFAEALGHIDRQDLDADARQRRTILRNQARCLGLAGQPLEAEQRLRQLQQRSAELDGVDSVEHALLGWQRVVQARRLGDPEQGEVLLALAREQLSALLPDGHPVFAHALRAEAAFLSQRGRWVEAETTQRAALERLEAGQSLPVDLAIGRAELAAIVDAQGRTSEARSLLDLALPSLRDSLLPQEVSRAEAEQLAIRLQQR